ncbi:RHS repeat-associated core domain-containing protein [Candidatus Electrothrix marina]|uniref:RHS repeat-associated core domain-containing protein n=1 Tax=Candidatus Electrothrix marina TaxID=1859130 RepID=A0A444JB75_9BACT|nr:RHS repeat-associated core domain-containing protein [Candidatus Electrothrix marina]
MVWDIIDPGGTDHAYGYDDFGQLDSATVPAGSFVFHHDAVGNRLNRTVDSTDVTGYSYAVGTNRLDQSTGATAASYGYDASGNIATESTDTTVYDLTDDQRLASVTKNSVTAGSYQYDGRGLRTVKTVNGEDTLFVYCKSGRLIAEADSDGNILKEYVYLEGDIFAHFQYDVPAPAPPEAASFVEPSQAAIPETAPEPVAAASPPVVAEASTPSDTAFLPAIYMLLLMNDKSTDGAYYYINDHLGAPQVITDDLGSVVWKAEYLPFGNVNISVAQIENNLRFPGQYYDAETGLHYNWNRYYDPETGRYIAADPIGLGGGINLYRYANSNPANWYDFDGLTAASASLVMYEAGTVAAGGQSNADRNKNIARGLQGYIKKCLTDAQIAWLVAKGVWHIILNESCEGDDCDQDRLPPGSKPIDKTPWSGDHGEIKDGIGNGPADDTWISPDDHVWSQNPDGTYQDHGPAGDYTGSGKPSGRRGKDRRKRWR